MPPGDPHLMDRTGAITVGTTDPTVNTIYISTGIAPPFLDRVLLHEVAHAITMSHNLLFVLRQNIPRKYWTAVEEWAAQMVESHGIEATALASESLGRSICVGGFCTI